MPLPDTPMPAERILVVDDDPAMRATVSAVLHTEGYETREASGPTDALYVMADAYPVDLVLTDMEMPYQSGLDLLRQLRGLYPQMPVIMISGEANLDDALESIRNGAVDYLSKPFSRRKLMKAVRRALDETICRKLETEYQKELEQEVVARTERLQLIMAELQRSYDITLEAMGDALDLRDAETQGHSKRVTAYTMAIARAMGVRDEELRTITRGAFLHDVGKIAIPDSILLKPGKLTDGEMTVMETHCVYGYEIVRKIPFLKDAAEIVYTHQEKFDGSGYPRGLRGSQIPLGARIFCVADALDAMTSDRPYRKALPFDSARAEVLRCSGTQFDPTVVEVFERMPSALWIELRANIMALLDDDQPDAA